MASDEEFPFPFPPYEIQKRFMKELYDCLENGRLGVFESPTGTGKSMSMICGALKWLTDYEKREKDDLTRAIGELDDKIHGFSSSSAHWFSIQKEQIELNKEKQVLQSKLDGILKFEARRKALKDTAESERKSRTSYVKAKPSTVKSSKNAKADTTGEKEANEDKEDEDLLLEEIEKHSDNSDDEDAEDPFQNAKVLFCSRTHSQLSQLLGEIRKSPYAQAVCVVTLASRSNYCINKKVQRLKHVNLMNEQCLQLQRKKVTSKEEKDLKKKKTATSCPYMPGNQDLLIGEVLSHIRDVEDIVKTGDELKTCAYYATRKAVPHGQLILVPYNSVLHKSTRTSSGINLKGSILIIDEAHNLLDAIERMHSATITGRQLLHCYSQLTQYQKRFQALFSAKSVLSLNQLGFCLKKLLNVFGATTKSHPDDTIAKEIPPKLYKVEEFEVMTEIDTVNIFQLLPFIKNSRLMHKLQAFTEQYGNVTIHQSEKKSSGISDFLKTIKINNPAPVQSTEIVESVKKEDQMGNPLVIILGFLECLKNSCKDGRICVTPGSTIGQGVMKFLLLNPAAHFHDIVKEARAVVLAGGTMAPMSEFTDQLFLAAGASPDRIVTFTCNHVVPEENITSYIVTHGPTGVEFEFNFQNRHNTRLLDELGRTLVNLCNIIPAGIVVFLPSYNFEETIYKQLQKSGFISKISGKKHIFREPKSASQVNQILEEYAKHIKNPQSPQNGSLLFSVVGGKLSEGLNFSDDLGRCVIVVGMPYPNIKSPELQEKMKYLNENTKPGAGKEFYENSCMKAVNQCIGRAIRHINDYATVVLLDKRYSSKKEALPNWIQRTLLVHNNFGKTMGNVAQFFAKKKKKVDI